MRANRVFGLDLMRAIAICLVIVMHANALLAPFVQIPTYGKYFGKLLAMTQPFGLLGVEMFFVLSGYLIGSILIRTYQESDRFDIRVIANFWVRRWFRTLPNYFLILTTLAVLYNTMGLFPEDSNLFYYALFIQNFSTPHPDFFPEAWSLAIEEWFYLLLPLTILGFNFLKTRKGKTAVLKSAFWSFLLLFVLIKIAHALIHAEPSFDFDRSVRKITLFRLDSILFGVLVALYYKENTSFFQRNRLSLFLLGVFGVVILTLVSYLGSHPSFRLYYTYRWYKFFTDSFLLVLLPACFASCLPLFINLPKPKSQVVYHVITHISLISYSMYLVHYSLIFLPFFNNCPNESVWTSVALYFLYWSLVIGISSLLFNGFELKCIGLRERISRA